LHELRNHMAGIRRSLLDLPDITVATLSLATGDAHAQVAAEKEPAGRQGRERAAAAAVVDG
jgi:hypothetical protein